jgi:UDP:flavonoid glycosyltransferase YjiC (YdhE family)
MKVLISSIGSRGDVQPILALALELRALGHNVSLCVAPNFKDWIESFGLSCAPRVAGTDCISIGDVNYEKLFPRVAAVTHHGGAGTTTAAVRAGRTQVVVPHLYDQYYWARRVQKLGVGRLTMFGWHFADPGTLDAAKAVGHALCTRSTG